MKRFLIIALALLFCSTSGTTEDSAKKTFPTHFVLNDAIWRRHDLRTLPQLMQFLKNQGYTGFDLNILDRQKNYYFYSPAMEKFRWRDQTNALTFFIKDWTDLEKTHPEYQFDFSLNIAPLAVYQNRVGPFISEFLGWTTRRRMENFFADFTATYDFDNLTSQPYSGKTAETFYKVLSRSRKKINLEVERQTMQQFLRSENWRKKNLSQFCDRLITKDNTSFPLTDSYEDNNSSIGLGDFAFALGRSFQLEVWSGVAWGEGPFAPKNLYLYRTAQYKPEGYYVSPNDQSLYIYDDRQFNFTRDIKNDIAEFYGISETGEERPIANLVLSGLRHSEREFYLSTWIDPVMNALLANGYQVRISFDRLLPQSDLYYVTFYDGKTPKKFLQSLLDLLNVPKSRFYGKVILHPLYEIKHKGLWKKLRQEFHIPPTEKDWIKGMPENVKIGGHLVPWQSTVRSDLHGMQFIRESAVRSAGGTVPLSEIYKNNTLALILKSDNHYWVNGNDLHLQSSYFLSLMMNHALLSPNMAYITSDRARTILLSNAKTLVEIKPQVPELKGPWRQIKWDRNGQRISDELIPAREIYRVPMNPFELIILETRPELLPKKMLEDYSTAP